MTARWLALSALTALLAFASDAQARPRIVAGNTIAATADEDFSAKAKYAKKQDGGWNRTKKYR
jgi:hypothetical protein